MSKSTVTDGGSVNFVGIIDSLSIPKDWQRLKPLKYLLSWVSSSIYVSPDAWDSDIYTFRRDLTRPGTYATAKYPNKAFDTFTNEPKREVWGIILKVINIRDK